MNHFSPSPVRSSKIVKTVEALLLLAAVVFLALHALHLKADFPNHSPWIDWAKYTDEGWYGDAAIRHFQRGHWYVPGDFNPAAALPVWPLLEASLFRFTGVNVVAARSLAVGIFALILLSSYLLLRRWQILTAPSERRMSTSFAPAVAVLLLAISPFCYAFTRMAILEPLLILFTLLALLAASHAAPPQKTSTLTLSSGLRHILPLLALGLLLPLMVLTKTTAICLVPAIAWLLLVRAGYSLRPFLRLALPPAILAASIWLGYYLLVVRPHFLSDYHYLFDANSYTGITPSTVLDVLTDTIVQGICIGNIMYPFALTTLAIGLAFWPRVMRNPLVPALLLWVAGYAAFLAYHANMQPRYYLVIAVPLTLLVPLLYEGMWKATRPTAARPAPRWRGFAAGAIAVVFAVLTVTEARQTLYYVRHPDYSYVSAAARIRQIVSSDHNHNPLILSISGSNLSLMTGLPSICDDFGTMDLAVRVRAYRPGWYIAWNEVEDDKMEALAPLYHLQRVADFPAMDDPNRNLLILYRLDPAVAATPPRPRLRPVPHVVRASFEEHIAKPAAASDSPTKAGDAANEAVPRS
jgi:hypothetical protein